MFILIANHSLLMPLSGEGKCFQITWKKVRELLDQDIPVILFGLDMFHLSYQGKFYISVDALFAKLETD